MIPNDEMVFLVAAGLVVLALIAAAGLWKHVRPAASKAAAHSNTPPPCRISLVAEEHPHWKVEKYVQRYAEHFRALGFQPIGAFRIPELDSQRILAVLHPGEKFYGCVYDHKSHPTFEIFADFSNEHALVGTNSVWVRDIEQRPGSITVRMANATPAQVFAALKQHEKAADRIKVSADGFVKTFLRAYVNNFNWRLKKCEISRDQVRLEARQEGRVVSSEQIEELYRAKRASYVSQLQDACRAQYRDTNKFDTAEWKRLQNRVVAVPETYDLNEVLNAISYALPSALKERQMIALQQLETSLGDDGIILVNKIITKNIAELNLKQVGEVTEPVRAWMVVAQEAQAAAPAPEPVPELEQKAA